MVPFHSSRIVIRPTTFLAAIGLMFTTAATARAEVTLLESGVANGVKGVPDGAYSQHCLDEGVPLPPDWASKNADGSERWRFSGTLESGGNGTDRFGVSHTGPLANTQSFIQQPGFLSYIYYFDSESPPGLCMANPVVERTPGSPNGLPTDNVDDASGPAIGLGVICQSTAGKVCFWELTVALPWDATNGTHIHPVDVTAANGGVNPSITGLTAPITPGDNNFWWRGGTGLLGNQSVEASQENTGGIRVCTSCHAGANAFVNHPGTATDLLRPATAHSPGTYAPVARSHYFPSAWPDPIVPLGFPMNPGPKDYSAAGTDGNCEGCHNANNAGQFPSLSQRLNGTPIYDSGGNLLVQEGNYCQNVLAMARARRYVSGEPYPNTPGYQCLTPASACVNATPWPSSGTSCPAADEHCYNGAMPPSPTNVFNNEFSAMLDSWYAGCQTPLLSADWESAFFGTEYGSGYTFPQWASQSPPHGGAPGQWQSPYTDASGNAHLLYYTNDGYGNGYTQLENVNTHFCWMSGFSIKTEPGQPSNFPMMSLERDAFSDNNTYWTLRGNNVYGSISAQCVPWQTIWESASDANNARRNWNVASAANSYSNTTLVYSSTPQPLIQSSPHHICYISGIDGDFLDWGDGMTASINVWPPGSGVGDGQRWYAQLSYLPGYSSFKQAHVTCIDLGMAAGTGPILDTFSNQQNEGIITQYDWGNWQANYAMTPVVPTACMYTSISATGDGYSWYNVQANQNPALDDMGAGLSTWEMGTSNASFASGLSQMCITFK
jgi:hypothetical protein